MADVPDYLVFGRVEDVVEGDGKLDGAEVRGKVSARPGYDVGDEGTYLAGELDELGNGQFLEILG